MKPSKLILHFIILAVAVSSFSPAVCRAVSEEDIFEKIKLLEVQIQELKDMKAQQNKTEEKQQHCIKAVGAEKFCICLAEALPGDISFEQYVHGMVSSVEGSGASGQRTDQGRVDAMHIARDKCLQK
ncbi:MAG: hypothetical protein KJ630_12835 [Proteobacteria bacterium]|nr:hypothetical protein [Pseudomonadota bacterium]